jgi:hypothetical protein
VRAAGSDMAAEQCIVDTCGASSQPAADLMTCMFYACSAECDELGAACDNCVLSQCSEPFQGCQSAGC